MGTLSGATANKIMTNTWLDSKISPAYHAYNFLTFNIIWKITNGIYTTKKCTYNAVKIQNDKIIYVLTQCTDVSGISDSQLNMNSMEHKPLMAVGRVLNKIYLPIINENISIDNLLSLPETKFPIESTSAFLGNLQPGLYTLEQIKSAINSVGTSITVNNSNSKLTIDKTLYDISNAGVEYGGNCINYIGVPPRTIANYINRTPEEDNSSKRAITENDFFNIFRNIKTLDYRCVKENIDMFNNITFYPTIGTAYTNYIGPSSSSNMQTITINISKNDYIIIPPTLTGLEYWNGRAGNYDNLFTQYLGLYRADENINDDGILIGVNNSGQKLNANDIAFNYEKVNNKIKTTFTDWGFFGIYTIEGNTNDMYGAALRISSANSTPLRLTKNRKVYPGDIYNRKPYITPRIAFETDQSIPVNIYNVDYLPISDAQQHYQHPTINRSLIASDGLEADNSGKAIVPVIYIPSAINLRYQGSVSANVVYNDINYPSAEITHRGVSFNVYKYAYGNRAGVSSQRVRYDDIHDMTEFLNQLDLKAQFRGSINHTQMIDGSAKSNTATYAINFIKGYEKPFTFSAGEDSSGNLILYVNFKTKIVSLYVGSAPTYTTITSIILKMTTTGIDDFLLGGVTSSERTTHTETTVCLYQNSTGSGFSAPSNASIGDDGIDTADYTIGSFDDF